MDLQKSLESTKKLYADFPTTYDSTCPNIEAIFRLPKATWEKELAFKSDDHWLMDVWRKDFDNRKERLEQIMDKVDLDIEWVKEIRVDCTRYLKLMMDYDMPVVQMDPEKVKPYF